MSKGKARQMSTSDSSPSIFIPEREADVSRMTGTCAMCLLLRICRITPVMAGSSVTALQMTTCGRNVPSCSAACPSSPMTLRS